MKRPLACAAGAFVLGEAGFLLAAVVHGEALVMAAGCLCFWYFWKMYKGSLRWLLPLFGVLGMARMWADQCQMLKYQQIVAELRDTQVSLEGTVADIREGERTVSLRLNHTTWHGQGKGGRYPAVMVYVDKETDGKLRFPMGGRVRVRGTLERFPSPGNPGEFDYGLYYHGLGIEGRMYGEIESVGEEYSLYLDGIYQLREKAAEVLETICAEEDAGLLKAVVLGDKSALSPHIRELYQRNGISHLLAVSGLHISFIGLGLYHLFRKLGLGFGKAGVGAAFVTVSYGILTGGTASVVRAVIMVLFQCLADCLGRTYDLQSALSAAALWLLVKSPALLLQSGFQLSFGAVSAIGMAGPVLQTWLKPQSKVGQTLLTGLVVQIVTLPVILYHFFEYPLYSILLNLLVIPFMGYVLLSGIAGVAVGVFSQTAGEFAIGTGHWILVFYQWLCQKFERLPGAVQVMGRPHWGQLAVYGLIWAGILGWAGGKKENSGADALRGSGKCVSPGRYLVTAVGLLGGFLVLRPFPHTGFSATFLDVGQGDGICLQAEEKVILVDGGSSDKKRLGEQVLEPFLKSRGIQVVDYAVVSHGDQDHISALLYILESECGIQIRHLVLPSLGKEEAACENLAALARKTGAEVCWMERGDRLSCGGLELTCLYAGEEGRKQDRNEQSLLLHGVYGETGILLTGDMSENGEKCFLELEEKETAPVQVLKIAHHGSAYSSSQAFLERIHPAWAVISCGEQNRYGHPSPETLKRLKNQGIQWLVTTESGAVLLESDGKRLWLEAFRRP